jgi:hypothetical protein
MLLMAAAMSTLPTALVVRASAMQNIIQRVAGALGLAVLGSILTQHQAQQFADRAALLPAVDPGFPLLQQIASQGRAGVLLLYSVLQVHVFAGALGDVFLLTAGITALGAPLALMLPDRTARRAAAPMPVAAAGAVPAAVASADPEGGADGAVPLDAAWIPAPWSQEPVGHGRSPGRRRVERHRRRRPRDRVEGADQRGAAPDEGVVEQPLAGAGRRRR